MKIWLTAGICLPCLALAQVRTVRFWYGYGDAATAQLARASGIDLSAAMGSEIAGDRLAVPLTGQNFKVSLFCEMQNPGGDLVYTGGANVNLAFDRTLCSDSGKNPVLNSDSFRKVRPAGANQNDMIEAFTNGAIVPAWRNSNWISDWDNDGVQDMAQIGYLQTLPSAWRQGTQGAGVSLRPVGLATYLSANLVGGPFPGASQGFKLPNATPFRVIDVNWISMLNVGETYGDRPGETGLTITAGNDSGFANTTTLVASATHTGKKYTLVAVVPEPASAIGLGLAALVLLRRKAGVH